MNMENIGSTPDQSLAPVVFNQAEANRAKISAEDLMNHMVLKLTQSKEMDDCHAYLLNNNVQNYGLTTDSRGNLLGECLDLESSFSGNKFIPRLQTVLTLPREGRGTLEPGADSLGAALLIGHKQWRQAAHEPQNEHTIYIVKDYATGAHLHEGTGRPVAVALKDFNFLTVAKILKSKFPKAKLIFFVNSGLCISSLLDRVWEAAQKVDGLVVVDKAKNYKTRAGHLTSSVLFLDDRLLKRRAKKIGQAVIGGDVDEQSTDENFNADEE